MDYAATLSPWFLFAAWLLPLLSFFVILVGGHKLLKKGAWIATGAIITACVLSFVTFFIWCAQHPPKEISHGHAAESHQPHQDEGGREHSKQDQQTTNRPRGFSFSLVSLTEEDDDDKATSDEPRGVDDEFPALSSGAESDDETGQGNGAESKENGDTHASDDGEEAGHEEHGQEKVAYAGEYYLLGRFGNLRLSIGYYIDWLTVCMFCMVTLIASCIHIYAMGYMHEELHDPVTDHEVTLPDGTHLKRPGRYARFFQYMSLFCFSMLGLVLAGNIAMVFVFWELVGICSYFLIGFYVERKSASNAANKAFIVNRVGDFGMIIGLMVLWTGLGTFAFGDTEEDLFEADAVDYHAALDRGELPDGLRQSFKDAGVVLPDFAEVAADGEGQWTIRVVGDKATYSIEAKGRSLLARAERPGMFSLVRPASHHHQLQTPGGIIQLASRDKIAKIVKRGDLSEKQKREKIEAFVGEVQHKHEKGGGPGYWLLIIGGIGIFCGCVGKSAQFPLHVWLPDAMEGPTPVSALVHSATMVAAGVYLVGRFYPMFVPEVLLVIAVVGCITLFMAATIALTATDIKRVLAYSTVSQLGYMMMALGVGAWAAGMMHLITHAFFKSLLFLCSGSVIHAVHTNEMTEMGGLLKKMPVTAVTMLIGCLAIAGASLPFIVGFSGYYSKDAILEQAFSFQQTNTLTGLVIFLVATGGAALTAFYMFRLWFLTFVGKPRDEHRFDHAHESPPSMYGPLILLATFAVCIAWQPLSDFFVPEGIIGALLCTIVALYFVNRYRPSVESGDDHSAVPRKLIYAPLLISGLVLAITLIWFGGKFAGWPPLQNMVLSGLLEAARPIPAGDQVGALVNLVWPDEHDSHAAAIKIPVTLLAFATGIGGFGIAAAFYWLRRWNADDMRKQFPSAYRFLVHKWWFDEAYDFLFVRPVFVISRLVSALDRYVIDWIIDNLARLCIWFSKAWDVVADQTLVDGFVNLMASWTYSLGLSLRRIQVGRIRQYVMFIVLATLVIFVVIFWYLSTTMAG